MVTSRRNPTFERKFPAAHGDGYDERSDRDTDYNCVAWAADQNRVAWWPLPDAEDIGVFWPPGVDRAETVAAFAAALGTVGYADGGTDGSLLAGVEQVAIYATAVDGQLVPQHIAWQTVDGTWSSKIGTRGRDIVHTTPRALASAAGRGTPYGTVVAYLSRPRRPRQCPVPTATPGGTG